ncbi:hypothetical protein BDF20DRAFT_917700 [Mycotypha africana]|uniref:uncharacterized protein n=1 Tax=Mycotypha africana TaxID=64632 RepID=UPI0023014445|nr:uncharacterized protein BDF20DRAFT_917700 [Mycotypha africana]KAI8967223.1 hypothetical protein BDF20DRAFT_917700 [Mycotypha africana]
MSETMSNYELKRKLNMENNEKLLKELGLTGSILSKGSIAADIPNLKEIPNDGTIRKKKRRAPVTPKRAAIQQAPSRLSRRLRGETPETFTDIEDILDDNDRVRQLDIMQKDALQSTTQTTMVLDTLPADIYTPFTLRSIGTTVWELGKLCTGKGRSKAWSSRGCKFKHPYPIGYRATKSHFDNDYTMGILPPEKEGEGPIFQVQHKSKIWRGATPTAPWTEACIQSKSSSTRVSGPLVRFKLYFK